MYWRPWRWTGADWLGAWIGAAIPGVIVGTLLATGSGFLALVFAPAIPIGGWVGGRFGSRIVAANSAIPVGLRAGAVATALGAGIWAIAEVIGTLLFQQIPVPDRVVQGGFIVILVALYSVFLGLPVSLPVGVGGAALLRAIRPHPRLAFGLLTALSFGALILSAVGLLAVRRW
jgi:hypothetical protein